MKKFKMNNVEVEELVEKCLIDEFEEKVLSGVEYDGGMSVDEIIENFKYECGEKLSRNKVVKTLEKMLTLGYVVSIILNKVSCIDFEFCKKDCDCKGCKNCENYEKE